MHASADVLPADDTMFAAQTLHAELAPVENVSAGQAAHAVALVELPYVPAAQALHVRSGRSR